MMLVKWITCDVDPHQRAAFDEAQRAWAPLSLSSGLVAQVGGWDDQGRACILALWQDAAAYKGFMEHVHDAITVASAQNRSYRRCSVSLADAVVHMPGAVADLAQACHRGTVLRVADCSVRAGHRDHFVGAQLTIWAPGMQAAPGMLGGLFSAARAAPRRYLVTTLWDSEQAHASYAQDRLPQLGDQAAAIADLDAIEGYRVTLDWGFATSPGAADDGREGRAASGGQDCAAPTTKHLYRCSV